MTSEQLEDFVKTSPYSAHEWFHEAVKTVDSKFGVGYAKKHPELIAAMVQATAIDFQTSVASVDLQRRLNQK